MNFNDTPEEAEFRLEARAWLDDNAQTRVAGEIYKLRCAEDGLMPLARNWSRLSIASKWPASVWI